MVMLIHGAIGALLTIGLYQLIRVNWPRAYYGPDETFAAFISSSPLKYAAFRMLPVSAMVASIGAYASRSSDTTLWALSGWFTVTYLGTTSAMLLITRRKYGRRPSIVDAEWILLSSTLVALSAIGGTLLAPFAERILPDSSVLTEAVVTAVFVALLIQIGKTLKLNEFNADDLASRAIRRNAQNLEDLEAQAFELKVRPEPIMAILVAESIQRPPWFQRLEGIRAELWRGGTVGPLQVPATSRQSARALRRLDLAAYLDAKPTIRALVQANSNDATISTDIIYSLHNASRGFVALCGAIEQRLSARTYMHPITLQGPTPLIRCSSMTISNKGILVQLDVDFESSNATTVEIHPPNAQAALRWRSSSPDPKTYFGSPEGFFEPWEVVSLNEDGEIIGVTSFSIQEKVHSTPRWD
ncbi:hypothetical protein ACXET9_03690 [Brachybacterium sp. DNPG3]